ncbi:hypothetical protein JCM10207_006061 [Rhodosporidiobolus poonsookiae]
MSDGSAFILPHYVTSWSVFLAILCIVMEGEIWTSLRPRTRTNGAIWLTLTWEPAFLALCFATWTLVCTYVVHCRTFTSRTRWPWYYRPELVNAAGIVTPLIHLAVTVTVSAVSGMHYAKGTDAFYQLDDITLAKEQAWTGTLNEEELESLLPLGQVFLDGYRSFIQWLSASCWWYSGSGLFLSLVFVTFAVVYIRTLRAQMHSLHQAAAASRTHIRQTWRSMVVVTAAFLAVFSCVVAIFFWTGLLRDKILTNRRTALIGTVLPFYIFTLVCLPTSIFIFYRALHDPAAHALSSRSHSGPHSSAKADPLSSGTGGGMPYARHVLDLVSAAAGRPTSPISGARGEKDPLGPPGSAGAHSAAFDNLELHVLSFADQHGHARNRTRSSSFDKETDVSAATVERLADPHALHTVRSTTRGLTDGVRVTRDAVTVVSVDVDAALEEEQRKAAQNPYAAERW